MKVDICCGQNMEAKSICVNNQFFGGTYAVLQQCLKCGNILIKNIRL